MPHDASVSTADTTATKTAALSQEYKQALVEHTGTADCLAVAVDSSETLAITAKRSPASNHAWPRPTNLSNAPMILEVAMLQIKPGLAAQFEQAFTQAQAIISAMPGYVSHQLQRCLEVPEKYVLLVQWQTLEDHTIGFRQSTQYQQWRGLLHDFYDPFPQVEHFEPVLKGKEHCY